MALGRIQQAMNRAEGVMKRRMATLAELVANGTPVTAAGRKLSLTAGETARAWAKIKDGLGEQAR
jgi:hypothetical protein